MKNLFFRLLLSAFVFGLCFTASAQISAKKTAAIVVGGGDGQANPGDTLRYTIVITNTSSTNLLNVQFADTGFSNQTLVAASIKSTPVARPDAYNNAIGNTLLTVPPASGVLTNDSDPDGDSVSVSTFSPTSVNGGTVTMAGDGSFTYISAAGFTGNDTFNYTISDGNGGLNTATVTITVTTRVWYVNNAGANGDGRQTSPFNSLANVNAVSSVSDYVYVFQGSGNYTAGITLKNSQTLVGSGDALIVNGTTILNAGSRPTLLATSGTGVSLATNNVVHGLNVGSSSGRAFSGAVGNLVISNVIASATGGAAAMLTNGTVSVTLDSATSSGSADNGINLSAISGSFVVNGGSIATAAGTDFSVSGGNGTVTFPGNINNTAGRSVDINGRTGGTVTLSGNITDTGTGLIVQNCTGGTVTFSGASKALGTGANTAVNLANNTGATINFTNGGLVITTTTGNGFTATGGGTVTVPSGGAVNTISCGSGTALNVVNTTIGASVLNFQSIAHSGGVNGIVLNNTGGGGLTVTGVGTTAGSGGTIQNTSNRGASFINAANITLKNMNFTTAGNVNLVDPNTGGGGISPGEDASFNLNANAGIHLVNLNNVTLDNLVLFDGAQQGINGNNVTNFNLSNSSIRGVGDQVREDGLHFKDMLGTSSIINTAFGGNTAANDNAAVQIHIENYTGPVGTSITVSNVNILSRGFAASGVTWSHGFQFTGHGPSNTRVYVKNTVFDNLFSNSIQADSDSTGTNEFTFNNNTFTNVGASGITLSQQNPGAAGTVRFNIISNGTAASPTFLRGINTGASSSININQADDAGHTTGGVLEGQITNNFIGNSSSVNSASQGGYGITIATVAPGTLTASVSGNNIQGAQGGIQANLGEDANPAHLMNLRIFSNTVSLSDVNAFDGIRVNAGTLTGDFGTVKLDLHDNNAGTVAAGNDFTVRPRRNGILQMLNYAGGATDDAAVITYLDVTRNNNPTGAGNDWFVTPQAPGTFGNTASVPGPTLPTP